MDILGAVIFWGLVLVAFALALPGLWLARRPLWVRALSFAPVFFLVNELCFRILETAPFSGDEPHGRLFASLGGLVLTIVLIRGLAWCYIEGRRK
jgi:hypothetical protein